MTLREEVSRKIGRDALLARLRRKIDSGKGTYADSFAYSDRAGKLLGEVFSRRLPDIPPEEREALCAELLHDRYTDINSVTDSVQKAQDAAQGLHLAPQHAPFNNERAHQIGSATADQTVPVETQQRRAKSATATMTRAMHDDRMKAEAKFRSRAGLKCYITRMTDGKCCPWCSKVAGRYEYGREPDGIYRRHDNCSCTVTFENGRKRQDVWSKREWEAPKEGAGAGDPVVFTAEQVAAAGAGAPVVLTKEQAAELEAQHLVISFTPEQAEILQKRLTNGAERGTMPLGDMFHTLDDPMREVIGSAYKNNFEELDAIIRELEGKGVEVAVSDSNESMGYQPAPSLSGGKPGRVKMARDASLSAWEHERRHALDDEQSGWNGRAILQFDPDERYQWEVRAYQIEIEMAKSYGREDIVERLKALLEKERRAIYGEDE